MEGQSEEGHSECPGVDLEICHGKLIFLGKNEQITNNSVF